MIIVVSKWILKEYTVRAPTLENGRGVLLRIPTCELTGVECVLFESQTSQIHRVGSSVSVTYRFDWGPSDVLGEKGQYDDPTELQS